MVSKFLLILFGIVWGRIINQLAYLFVCEYASCTPTSYCLTCRMPFCWYQRIPLVSYIAMKGRCPYCHEWLSLYNPLTELLAVVVLYGLYYGVAPLYRGSYLLFFSALLITFRTDIETMLISRMCTTYLIPVALVLSSFRLLPISLLESMLGAVIGYFLLYAIMYLFYWITKTQGMGLGDLDLLACIGAFTGPLGCWVSLLLGSTLGSLIGIVLLVCYKKSKQTPITFGPFLVLGALAYVIWQQDLVACLFHICV